MSPKRLWIWDRNPRVETRGYRYYAPLGLVDGSMDQVRMATAFPVDADMAIQSAFAKLVVSGDGGLWLI